MRTATIQRLADGMFNALTNINGGSTHLNVRDWLYWKDQLTFEELQELYRKILSNALELYAVNDVPLSEFEKLLPH